MSLSPFSKNSVADDPALAAQQATLSAFFIPSFEGGGAEKVMVQIASRLAQRGHSIHLVVANDHGPCKKLVHENVKVFNLGRNSVTRSIPGLVSYVRSNRPAVVMSTMLHANLALVISAFFFNSNTRLVAREALPLSLEMHQSRKISLLTKVFYRRFDAFISLTQCQQKDRHAILKSRESNKDWIIPNPVELNQLVALSDEQPEKPLPDSFDNRPIIVACGRLSKQKGFDVLLRAFSETRKSVDCSLVILGEGDARASLEALAADLEISTHLWMPGFLENPHPYVKRCAVFVLSSFSEGMPNALLQAYVLGKRCVATDCLCGPSEILAHPGLHRLVEVGNHVKMSLAIQEMLDTPEQADGHPDWSKHYDIDEVCDKFSEALQINPPRLIENTRLQ
ncbi:MAG: glycosyltransferase [Granulosicoccus sp.]